MLLNPAFSRTQKADLVSAFSLASFLLVRDPFGRLVNVLADT